MEKIAVLAPMPSASERIGDGRDERRRAQLAYGQPHVLDVSSGSVPGARTFRHFEKGGCVQCVERATTRFGLACATCQRCGVQLGKVTRKLVDDIGR